MPGIVYKHHESSRVIEVHLGHSQSKEELDARMAELGYEPTATAEDSSTKIAGFPQPAENPLAKRHPVHPPEAGPRSTPRATDPAAPQASGEHTPAPPSPIEPSQQLAVASHGVDEPSIDAAPPAGSPSLPSPGLQGAGATALSDQRPPATQVTTAEPAQRDDSATWATPLVITAIAVLAVLVHGSVSGSNFRHDDFLHLYASVAHDPFDFLTTPHGGHFMPVHKLFYLVLHRLFGIDAAPFFALVLATHVINGALLFLVSRELTGRAFLSAAFAGLWTMAPVHANTLGWFAAYGQVLLGTLVLLVLFDLTRAARTDGPSSTRVAAWSVALLLGAMSFGVGIGFLLAFPLVAFLMLKPGPARRRAMWILGPLVLLAPVVFLVGREEGGPTPDLAAAVVLFLDLVGYGAGSTLLGWLVSVAPDNASVLGSASMTVALALSVTLLALVAVAVVKAWRNAPAPTRQRILALLLLAAAAYGIIALGRSGYLVKGIEWTATRPRYHYVAPLGLLLAAATSLAWLLPQRVSVGAGKFTIAGATALLWLFLTEQAAAQMEKGEPSWVHAQITHAQGMFADVAKRAPPSPDAIYVKNQPFPPLQLMHAMGVRRSSFPDMAGIFLVLHPEGRLDGRPLRFVEADVDLVKDIREQQGANAARLLVTEKEANQHDATVLALNPSIHVQGLKKPPQKASPTMREAIKRKLREDPKARERFRRALNKDPDAREKFKRALERDPEARERFRRAREKDSEAKPSDPH